MSGLWISNGLRVCAMGLAIFAFTPEAALAAGDTPAPAPAPKPKPNPKPKPKSKDKDKDKSKEKSAQRDAQIYSLGYWQAKGGEYAAALATLRTAENQADPRVQTMIGFSLRKLGRVDEAMQYYAKVLAAHPERTNTRQYLGEAFLQSGEVGKAREQLAEIAKRCGVACEDYQLLADEIAKFENKQG